MKSINHKVHKGLHKGHKALNYMILTWYSLYIFNPLKILRRWNLYTMGSKERFQQNYEDE